MLSGMIALKNYYYYYFIFPIMVRNAYLCADDAFSIFINYGMRAGMS